MLGFIIGLVVGAWVGFAVCALLSMNRDDDDG